MSSTVGSRPRLIIHIGAPKTGSSAIQAALAAAAPSLREAGILVPDCELGTHGEIEGHQVFFVERSIKQPTVLIDAIDRLRVSGLPGRDLRAIVISAENLLERGAALAGKLAVFKAHFDVQIVAFVRRQDDLFASAWQQWYCKVHSDLWAWTISELGRYGNWWQQLQPWLAAFGREHVAVRIYPPRDHGDSVRDFFEACALPFDAHGTTADRSRVINPSFNLAVQGLAEGNAGLFASAHDNGFFDAVHDLLDGAVRKQPGEHLFGVLQRIAILKHYRGSNENLRAAFFPEMPAPLFPDPPADGITVARRRPVTVEQLREEVDVLTKLFVEMYKRSRSRN